MNPMSGISPSVSAACGAALVFYGSRLGMFPLRGPISFYQGLLIILVILVGLLWSMEMPLEQDLQRRIRYYSRLIIALGVGSSIGLVSLLWEKQNSFIPPMQIESIQKVQLTMMTDLRLLPSGSLGGQARVQFCEDSRGVRISSRGVINLMVTDNPDVLRNLAGQGSELIVDGHFASKKNGGGEAPAVQTFLARRVVKIKAPLGFQNLRFAIRKVIVRSLRDQPWGGLAAALLLGVRDDLNQDVITLYRRSGSSHVLALSGMHLGILAGLLAFLLRKPLGVSLAAVVSLAVLICYVSLAGFQPSLTRSLIMYTLIMFCFFKGITASFLSPIAISFLIQLSVDPMGMASLSAMLSYLALTGIVLLGPPIVDVIKGWVPQPFAGAFATSLGAFIATAPLVVSSFGVLYPIGIVVGAFLGLIAASVMLVSILYVSIYLWVPLVSPIVGSILTILYNANLTLLRCSAALSVQVNTVNWALAGLLSLAMAGLFVYGQYRGKAKRSISAFN